MKEILRLDNVSKRFRIFRDHKTLFRLGNALLQRRSLKEDLWALRHLSFSVQAGEKIAIIGRNGAGKTTLIRILGGIFRPTEGKINVHQPVTPLFSYGLGMNQNLPVIDNIYIIGAFYGLTVRDIDSRLQDIVRFSGLEKQLYVQVKDLSNGETQRLTFSIFIQTDFPIMAFDESTAMADHLFKNKAKRYFEDLYRSEKTVILSSHSMPFLTENCSRALWLERGHLLHDGPVKEVTEMYLDFCKAVDRGNRRKMKELLKQTRLAPTD